MNSRDEISRNNFDVNTSGKAYPPNTTVPYDINAVGFQSSQPSSAFKRAGDLSSGNNNQITNTNISNDTDIKIFPDSKSASVNNVPPQNFPGVQQNAQIPVQIPDARNNTTRVMPQARVAYNPPAPTGTPTRVMQRVPTPDRQIANDANATRVMNRVPPVNTPHPSGQCQTRVMPKVPSGTTGHQASSDSTRVMPRVTPNGAVQGQNPNATRVMQRIPPNSTTPNNHNSTRVMPVTPNRIPSGSNPAVNNTDSMPYGTPAGRESIQRPPVAPNNPAMNSSPYNAHGGIPARPIADNMAINNANPDGVATKKGKSKKKKGLKKGNIFIGITKFILYICFVAVVSVLLSKYLIGAGNDIFAFVKDTYNYTDTVYSTKGDATNSFEITKTRLSGDKFEFSYKFASALTDTEKEFLDASILVIDTKDNAVVHNYGKYTTQVSEGQNISLDLANAKMSSSNYIIRLTVGTGNNVFYITEFYMSKKPVDITISEDASTTDVAKVLKSHGLIDYPSAFKMYAKMKKGENSSLGTTYVEGTHTLYAGMDYDEILYAISPKVAVRSTVRLTFPEGSTVDEIIDILVKGGVKNTKAEYIEVLENYEQFDYRFIDLLKEEGTDSDRVYSLEGYLFPDTYEFYTDSSPEAVIDKFLANFDAKFDDSFYDEASKLGLSVDEIVQIASLVESEAGNPDDKVNISSVFHNRLNDSVNFPRLESDATIDYASYNIKSLLKFSEYKCTKCDKKETKQITKCSECGNTNSYIEYNCASISVKLPNYSLIDGEYYINFSISSQTTRAKSIIFINKKTVDGKAVYSVSSEKSETNPVMGYDISSRINNLKISNDGVLTCEILFEHGFDSEAFSKFPTRLNIYRCAYDTYTVTGLMPGPISNPGYQSIIAALYPNKTNYRFFVADNTGDSHFSVTKAEHDAMINKLKSEGKAVSSN